MTLIINLPRDLAAKIDEQYAGKPNVYLDTAYDREFNEIEDYRGLYCSDSAINILGNEFWDIVYKVCEIEDA